MKVGKIKLVALFSLLSLLFVPAMASTNDKQLTEIDKMVSDEVSKSKIPSTSIGIIDGQDVHYRFYGDETTNEDSLYCIGSVTKAYTALGILLLEERGLLSTDDPVSDYLPWFTPNYKGEPLDKKSLTIANLLHQTSGFTNDEGKFPQPKSAMTLVEGVRSISGQELVAPPSTQYNYANVNFNTLGVLIETISGQTYEAFMTENILLPLGLRHTYINTDKANKTGNMMVGNRLSFFRTIPYEIAPLPADIPAGYIVSTIQDMTRWLQIQMGSIEVSPQFTKIISKSHIVNKESMVDEQTSYASGWFVKNDGTIFHSGGTPNYSSKVVLNVKEGFAVCVLTNLNSSVNTNRMADNTLKLLEGKSITPYQADVWSIIDQVFSLITISCLILFLLLLVFLVNKKRWYSRRQVNKKIGRRTIVALIGPTFLLLIGIGMLIIFPIIFSSNWSKMWIWAPYSLFTGLFSYLSFSLLLWVVVAVGGSRKGK